jgi:hypothetical protein
MTMTKPPSDSGTELVAAILKGAVSAVPFAGGLLAEVGSLYLNPLESRRKQWMDDVSDALERIRRELDVLPEQLKDNERFISILYQATPIAIRNHQSLKREALRNVLISSVSGEQQDFDQESMFLRFVDELGVMHIRLLSILSRSSEALENFEKLDEVYAEVLHHLGPIDRVAFRAAIQDLEARFLVRLGDVEDFEEYRSLETNVVDDDSKVRKLMVTGIGEAFLAYIRADEFD